MTNTKRMLLASAALLLGACTDAEYGKFSSLGEPAIIDCYSGGKRIYHGRTNGKLEAEHNSDGWYFIEVGGAHLVRVSGQCIIRQKTSGSVPLPTDEEIAAADKAAE